MWPSHNSFMKFITRRWGLILSNPLSSIRRLCPGISRPFILLIMNIKQKKGCACICGNQKWCLNCVTWLSMLLFYKIPIFVTNWRALDAQLSWENFSFTFLIAIFDGKFLLQKIIIVLVYNASSDPDDILKMFMMP